MASETEQGERNSIFTDEAVDALIGSIEEAKKRHEKDEKTDSVMHNYGTALAMVATTTATVLPMELSLWTRVAAGVGTFLIAFLGRLDFGARWRWQMEMRAEYQKYWMSSARLRHFPSKSEQGM
jgi:hypothetical protein